MPYKISKELFEVVMGYNTICFSVTENSLNFKRDDTWCEPYHVNHFFFNCKEWALSQGFEAIESGMTIGNSTCMLFKEVDCVGENFFEASTEQQAVFDACQFILENYVKVTK